MIEARHLHKSFGNTRAVQDVSFSVQEGENFILLGTSGCGKTTTLKMLNRLLEPDEGQVLLNGADTAHIPGPQLRRGMGYVLQHMGLFPHYTVAENIAVVPRLLHWQQDAIQERTATLMQKLGLSYSEHAHVYPHQLSGGQQQRVGLARALAADPPVLLMDEPFGALDPITRDRIRSEFSELDEFKKKTIVMVTHDVHEAFTLATRVCLMDKGRIVQMGTPGQLREQPANDFVRTFLKL